MAQVSYGTITITDTNDIESIIIEYARNQSTSSAPDSQTGGWSTTRPAWAQGYYIWQRARIHKSGTDSSEDELGTAVCITGSTGQTGTSITISSISYAVSTTESQPADSNFTYTTVPTVAENSWLWTKTEYSDGSKVYTKSKQGKSGNSITVTKTEYQSGTSPSTAPTGSWSTSIPSVAEGNYLWTKTTYSDGNYSYTVAKQGQSGTSVTISSTSVKYQVSTNATSAPTGTWQDDVQATTTGQYLWTRTIVTYSNGSSTTSYSVSAHGATGTSVSVSSIKYAKSTTDSQPSESSFGTTIPTVDEGEWLWTMTTYSNGSKMYTKSKQGKSGEDGRSLTATETKYTNVASGTTQSQVESLVESSWVNNVPSYDASKPDYWIRIKNTYDKAPTTEYIYYKDNAVGDALAAAAMANSLAQSANENANGAMGQAASNVNSVTRLWWSQATATPVPRISTIITDGATNRRGAWSNIRPTDDEAYPYYFYCDQTITGGGVASWSTVTLDTSTLSKYEIEATNVRTKNFFKGQDDTYDGWFASGRSTNEGLDESDATTYYYNARFAATNITLGYNKTPVIDLDGSNGTINIYRFPTIDGTSKKVTSVGALGMKLSATDLKFYNSSGVLTSTFGDSISLASNGASITIGSSQNEHITIDTNGLKIYGNYSYNNSGTPTLMYGLLGSFGSNSTQTGLSVQIGPLNTGHITLSTTGATFYDSANTTIGVIGNTDLHYSTESYEEIVEVNWVSNETFTYDKQFNYDTNINSILIAIKNGDTIDWSSAQTVTSPWGRVYINLDEYMVPITISPSAVTGRTDCIFSSTSTNPTTDTTLAFKINHTPSMPGPHYSFGIDSIAPGTGSFAAGRGIKAVGPYQTVLGRYNKKDLDASFIIGNGTNDANRSNLFVVDGNGNLRVNNGFQIYNNDETDSIAEFGTTARIGKINNSHFLMNANSLQAYNSSNQLYFEVSNTGIRFGNNLSSTVATQADVAGASYSVEIQVSSIDYTTYSATLVAVPYYKGVKLTNSTTPSLSSITYQWYKNGVALSNTGSGVTPSISGVTTSTLELGSGTDFGTDGTNPTYALYTCVISN